MTPANRQIIQEAAEWFVEINGGDADLTARRGFDSWLRASPEHVRAFLEILPVWEDGADEPPTAGRGAEELIGWARAAADTTGMVVPLRTSGPSTEARSPPRRRSVDVRRWRIATAAAAVIVGCAALLAYRWVEYPTFQTGIGEQRSWMLADGSTVELNARSKIRVHLTPHRRDIELLDGQALFRVAHDTARPFVVSSGATQVTAVGTQFDVYRKSASTIVTVLEGRIAVVARPNAAAASSQSAPATVDTGNSRSRPRDATAPLATPDAAPVLVAAGGQVTVTAHVIATSEHPDLAVATAWTQHELVFNRSTLSSVADEFNRYNERPLVVAPALADIKISGIFSSTDAAPLLRFLQEQPGVKIEQSAQRIRISPAD